MIKVKYANRFKRMRQFYLFVIFCFFQCQLFSQQPAIKNLVFEGAGIRGIAYCGAIHEMEANNLMGSVEKVGGTSAGAIIALLLSLGYNGNEIEQIISSTKFKKFNDGKFFFIGGIHRMRKNFGWFRGKRSSAFIEKLIVAKTKNADITFTGLHEQGFKELHVTGTSLNRQQLLYFNRHTYPLMKVKDAIRISMTIPLYFEPLYIDSNGRVLNKPVYKKEIDVMVDGGITGNFPIHLFDADEQTNPGTLGFRIDSEYQVESDKKDRTLCVREIRNLKTFVAAFYIMTIENLNRQGLTDADWKRTVSISDGHIGPRIRKLNPEELNTLIENGRKAMQAYLKQ